MNPRDPGAGWAADGGHLRVSDLDRELMVDFLKSAFVQGKLSHAELADRTGQALEARTRAQLVAVAAGISAAETTAVVPRQPVPVHARSRPVSGKVIAWVLSVIVVLPGLGYAFFATVYGSFFIMMLLALIGAGWLGSDEVPARHPHAS